MSSGSESDEDYVPEEPQKLSEEESADEETEKQYENEVVIKDKKRKIVQEAKGKKKRKTRNVPDTEPEENEQREEEEEVNPEEQKKREDDLWAMFLDGTDTKPKEKAPPKATEASSKPTISNQPATSSKIDNTKKTDDAKERERRIFEFAGETIVVENNVIKEKIKDKESPETALKLPRAGAGISSVLGQLNKKNQLSTLEKSKLDWQTFKKEEGIEEEIQSHNKGKNGYLEKRDFLERADYRQYEIERNLRLGRRSNR